MFVLQRVFLIHDNCQAAFKISEWYIYAIITHTKIIYE